jgi:hypothetical protein
MSTANFRKLAGQDALGDVTTGRINAKGNVANAAANGITAGVGTVIKSSVERNGGLIKTKIYIDLTGLASSTTDLDIIGKAGGAAYLTQITRAVNGNIVGGTVTCLEAAVGGVTDIDLYAAVEGTSTEAFDYLITSATETALVTRGGAWALGDVRALSAVPAADAYLYLTGGAAGTAAAYSAGKFMIELIGV